MADRSRPRDATETILAMERQAVCLAAYFKVGDIENAVWLLHEMCRELDDLRA